MTAATPAVDVHTHWMPLDLAPPGDADPEHWPTLVQTGDDTAEIRIGRTVFRQVGRSCWDAAERAHALDARPNVDVEVILPVPVTIDYRADPTTAIAFARAQNDEIAAAAAGSKGRLVGFGSVPLQHPTLAIAELRRAVGELGLRGVEIGASVGGLELCAPELRSFFRVAAEIGARIFVHPLDGGGGLDRCSGPLEAFGIGMLTDTALAATALTFGGVLAELPELVVCLSHGGGSFAWSYPRLLVRELYGRGAADAERRRREIDALVRRLYVDSVVFDPLHLAVLTSCFGPGLIVFGTDHPFIPPSGPDVLERAVLDGVWSAESANRVRTANAVMLTGACPS